jgi:ABC-type antimicrobial peptide transport system permease subunit
LIAPLLTITGVYGVVAYVVAQRPREVGVRIALGATCGDVVRLAVRQLMWLALAAVACGGLSALARSWYLASQFTFVDAYSVAGYATGVGIVLLSSAVAAYIPSRRAATVNLVEASRRLLIRAPADETSAKMIPDSRYAALTRLIFLSSAACVNAVDARDPTPSVH